MKFILTINCDNDAFEERTGETARILREIAAEIDRNRDNSGKIRDVTGNTVGSWRFGEERK